MSSGSEAILPATADGVLLGLLVAVIPLVFGILVGWFALRRRTPAMTER